MIKTNTFSLPNYSFEMRELNFGIILLSLYFLFDFGSFQGVFEIVNTLKLPFIVAVLSVLYVLFLTFMQKIDFSGLTTKTFIVLCFFLIVYAQISTPPPDDKATLTLFVQYLCNYLIMISCVKKPSQFIFLMNIWLFAILHSSYHSIYQGGKVYDSIWLRDENHISLVVAMAIPFAYVLLNFNRSFLKKAFYFLCLIVYIVANLIAASRGGALAMILVGLLCWKLSENKMKSILLIGSLALFIFIVLPNKYTNKFTGEMATLEEGTKEETAADRMYLWGIALKTFRDNPIIGVGPYNHSRFILKYDSEERYYHRYLDKSGLKVAHSTPLQWLAEFGIVGTMILILLQVSMYRNWKIIKEYKKIESDSDLTEHNLKIFEDLNHACAISQVVFWFGALFLSLMPYPFYWCLIPFSETWKNIYVEYLGRDQANTEHQFVK
jgi:O-antigen ligase